MTLRDVRVCFWFLVCFLHTISINFEVKIRLYNSTLINFIRDNKRKKNCFKFLSASRKFVHIKLQFLAYSTRMKKVYRKNRYTQKTVNTVQQKMFSWKRFAYMRYIYIYIWGNLLFCIYVPLFDSFCLFIVVFGNENHRNTEDRISDVAVVETLCTCLKWLVCFTIYFQFIADIQIQYKYITRGCIFPSFPLISVCFTL